MSCTSHRRPMAKLKYLVLHGRNFERNGSSRSRALATGGVRNTTAKRDAFFAPELQLRRDNQCQRK